MSTDTRGNVSPLLGIVVLVAIVMSFQSGRRTGASPNDGDNQVRRRAILGESRTLSNADRFQGGDLTAVMGECELDLRRAGVAPGDTATIEVFAMMGQVTLRVPDNWVVDTDALTVLGGVQDHRSFFSKGQAGDQTPSQAGIQPPRIVVHGFVMMGALAIKD